MFLKLDSTHKNRKEEVMEYNGITNKAIEQAVYENLPPVLKQVTEHFSGREKDIVLLSSIGVLSTCLPNIYGIYDGDEVAANLYILIIAPPSSGKGVMNYSRRMIEPIHDKILRDSKAEIQSCEEQNKQEKKKKDGEINICPPLEVKILPANISSAEMYSYLGASKHGLLIIESEADTMSNMLSNDWSNYSDVLRKTFHHEPISISRKMEKVFEDIKEPKLSIVMSGTPDQVKPVVKSKGNGLFSRFILYTFDEIKEFKDVFHSTSKFYKTAFQEAADEVFKLYGKLYNLNNPIEFQFTEEQQEKMIEKFRDIHNDILENHPQSFIPNLNRHGLILFRICMILTALRGQDFESQVWTCSDDDFDNALSITTGILQHALIIHNTIEDGVLSKADDEFLFGLGIQFTRQKAVEYGEKLGIPQRTVDDKLVQWRKKKLVKKIKQGLYKRIAH